MYCAPFFTPTSLKADHIKTLPASYVHLLLVLLGLVMRPSQPAPDYTEMANMNDTKYRSSTPSDSSRGNVVDHNAANGQYYKPPSFSLPPPSSSRPSF